MPKSLVIHGHFYQPPRENPWTDAIDDQPGAAPFANWNEKIYSECYRANAFARISDTYGRVEQIVNNYSLLNFNFGPTLLSWIERTHPRAYKRIIAADAASATRHSGHGNAIAQAYHHSILPLCNERDRLTEIRWGAADFRIRFGRAAEAMWLPETACDARTLGALIDAGMRYVILSPQQAERVRKGPGGTWRNVNDGSIDSTQPYAFLHPDKSGRSLAIFFYDADLARAIAFQGALASSQGLVDRIVNSRRGDGELVNIATDGESYGHHYRYGDRAVAYALQVEAARRGLRVTNYAEYLAENPPTWEVEVKAGPNGEGSAWSCAHGLGRWTRDCGCQTGGQEGWNQQWRTPLRLALEYLRDRAADAFVSAGAAIFRDPWAARDGYINLLTDPSVSRDMFFAEYGAAALSEADRIRGLSLLEMQRASLMMFTSCGWFFNDLAGIETVQIMLYAGRVLERLERLALPSPREPFLEILAEAKSNVTVEGNGADIFRKNISATRFPPEQAAAQVAISELAGHREATGKVAAYKFAMDGERSERHGRITLATGWFTLRDAATDEPFDYAVGALYFGDVDFYCALRPYAGEAQFAQSADSVWSEFPSASLPRLLRLVQESFGPAEFGLEHLLADGRRQISEMVFRRMVDRFSETYEKLYEDNRRNLDVLHDAGFVLPKELLAAAEFTVARQFETALRAYQLSDDAGDWQRAKEIGEEIVRHGYRIPRNGIWRMFEQMITRTARQAAEHPTAEAVRTATDVADLANRLKLELNLDRAQEALYDAMVDQLPDPAELRELALMLNVSPTVVNAQSVGSPRS
jgi:alpha-amylase/alpha-mannosidase (GH57 family)